MGNCIDAVNTVQEAWTLRQLLLQGEPGLAKQ